MNCHQCCLRLVIQKRGKPAEYGLMTLLSSRYDGKEFCDAPFPRYISEFGFKTCRGNQNNKRNGRGILKSPQCPGEQRGSGQGNRKLVTTESAAQTSSDNQRRAGSHHGCENQSVRSG